MANQKPNYISERQRYIPNIFDTAAPAEVTKCLDYDTQMSELLAKYSLLFKCENIAAVENIEELRSTRRGTKFLGMCEAKFGSAATQGGDDKFRIVIVKNYRGVRISRNFDEDQKILIFDENGFLAGSPTGFSVSNSSEDKAFMMVADGVLYIAFRHLRYDSQADDERDTTCENSYTSSKNFHVVGVVMTQPNFTAAPSVSIIEGNNTDSDYFSDNCRTRQDTNKIPKKIGILINNPPTGMSAYDISRWISYYRTDSNFEHGLFVKIDLEEYAEFLEDYEANHSSVEDFLDSEASGLSFSGNYGGLNNLRNIYKEIARILRDRSKFVYSIAIDKEAYTPSVNEDGIQFALEDYSEGVKGLQLKIIDNYQSFYANGDCTVTFMPRFLPEGSQFFAQNREKTFRCQLRLKHNQNGKYSITSIGDNDVYGQALRRLKLFDEDHGLYAIPLTSYDWVSSISGSTPLPVDGVPCLLAKTPDVMMWIDGVKMVPYIDYTVEEGSSSSISGGQHIKMRRLPGHSAAPTAGNDEYTDDDPMFPLPLAGAEYTINVVLTAQRGCSPVAFGSPSTVYECDGILERYIGPMPPEQGTDPVYPADRQVYPGNLSEKSVLFRLKNSSDDFEVNAALNYGAFKMFPVGALADTAILHFQNGRYIPTASYEYRVAGDRIFVSNSKFENLQDMEFHIFLDMCIPKITEISDTLSREEGNFDKMFKYFFSIAAITPGSAQESYVNDRMRDFVSYTTGLSWTEEETKQTLAGDNFLGFARWINTSSSLEYGALNTYIAHHGYTDDPLSGNSFEDDVVLDANRNLSNEGFRSINIDPSEPTITGEVLDVPDQNI
jgi:hypothetical protein